MNVPVEKTKTKVTPVTHTAKKLARLAAVQALYQSHYEQQSLEHIMRDMMAQDFVGFKTDEDGSAAFAETPDKELFAAIVQGVTTHAATLDEMLSGTLDARFSLPRLELLLRTILRAGVFELLHHQTIQKGIIINDYVDVTRAFFNEKEPGLVNGVLDKLAGTLRS